MKRYLIFLALLSSFSSPVWSVDDVVVMALFANKAVLQIDGKRKVLKVGERSANGVLLVSADSEHAVLEVNGKQDTYYLGAHISGGYKAPKTTEVNLWADSAGMFETTGSINGQLVEFLVDTGATTIAMNAAQAKRLGIDYLFQGQPVQVSTASAVETGYLVKLKTVKVGEIKLREVSAIIMDSPYPEKVLLGMSFLGRIEMERRGMMMLLRKIN